MEVTAIILDRQNQEIKIYFGHTDYCVNAKLDWKSYKLYCHFNNIKGPELEIINLNPLTVEQKKRLNSLNLDELVCL